jgi:pimeloyl-ACP methyl ester carboxylesterase
MALVNQPVAYHISINPRSEFETLSIRVVPHQRPTVQVEGVQTEDAQTEAVQTEAVQTEVLQTNGHQTNGHHTNGHHTNSNQAGVVETPLPALMLIHGNSFSKRIFKHVLDSEDIARQVSHIVAFDLPGHGDSKDATHPETEYSMHGYADSAVRICEELGILEVIVVGWSLGGHVAIEMIHVGLNEGSKVKVKGILIMGTPPVNANQAEICQAFKFGPHPDSWRTSIAATEHLTAEQRYTFAHQCADPPFESWMQAAVDRTHGLARRKMFETFVSGSRASHQRQFLEVEDFSHCLIGVLNGKNDPFINLDWVKSVKYQNLWKDECLEWEGCSHAPFWAKPEEFKKLLLEFIADVKINMLKYPPPSDSDVSELTERETSPETFTIPPRY